MPWLTVADQVTSLDYSERWLRDGLHECGRAGGFEAIVTDATAGSAFLARVNTTDAAIRITWTHIFVRASAMALARNPELHQLVAGNLRLRPASIDICLSITGDSCLTPVLIIQNAAAKDLAAIAAEVVRRTPGAVEETDRMLNSLRRFGWLVPFSGCRRALAGFMLRRPWYRRKASGTFQVTCLPQVDLCAPLLFNTAAALGVGRVRDQVVAVDGQAVVRPTVTLYCCVDHGVWNGAAAAKFLATLCSIVESGEFAHGMSCVDSNQTAVNMAF